MKIDPKVADYLRKHPSDRTADAVPKDWPQHRVDGGVIAKGCSGSDHEETLGCWAFYPDREEADKG